VGAKDRFQRGGVELAQEVAHGEAGARFPRPKTAMTRCPWAARKRCPLRYEVAPQAIARIVPKYFLRG
jgi:hypothetical protein